MSNLATVEQAIEDFRAGRMVIIVDDEKRENEGDLCLATSKVTAEHINFMMRQGRGLICVSVSQEIAKRLNFPLQVEQNNSVFHTPFAVCVDHNSVAENGVTAANRALTMLKIVEPNSTAQDFLIPGHVFPLIANPSGVLGREGQTEGSYDLARLAGLAPSGIICEILNPDGTMTRGQALYDFAKLHKLNIISVEQIIKYRITQEILIRQTARNKLQTDYGEFDTHVFLDEVEKKENLALVYNLKSKQTPLVRLHSECLTGDVFGSRRCDCGSQLSNAMQEIVKYGCGALLYLRQEGRGIGLVNKLRAYQLQDQGHDTVEANLKLGFEADKRDFAVAAKMLTILGLKKIKLLTNNPNKLETLKRFGIEIEERIPTIFHDQYCQDYLETKKLKMGHLL